MIIGAYVNHGSIQTRFVRAFVQGAERLGHSVIFRNPAVFHADQIEDIFDFIFVGGSRNATPRKVISAYKEYQIQLTEEDTLTKNVPAIVYEQAFFHRSKYMTLGIGKQYWCPENKMPGDRWKALNIEIKPWNRKEDGYILVCAQDQMVTWEKNTVQYLKSLTKRPIVVRHHPMLCPEENIPPLAEHLAGAYCVVVDTSNVGNEALAAGIPVFCSPEAMFAQVAETDFTKIDTFSLADLSDERADYFNRLAYGQWTNEEVANGTALKWILSRLQGVEEVSETHSQTDGERIENKVTAITCTGDRPNMLKNCIDYMARQTRKPDEWVIVDDGKKQSATKEDFARSGVAEIKVIRRKQQKTDPPHTMPINLLTALQASTGSKFVVFEDDDWYAPEFVSTMIRGLDTTPLFGIQDIRYWNIEHMSYVYAKSPQHSALCQTAFIREVIPYIEAIVNNKFPEVDPRVHRQGLVDIELWKRWDGPKTLIPHIDVIIGIKGYASGRKGLTHGHLKGDTYTKDPGFQSLEGFIGTDIKRYANGA